MIVRIGDVRDARRRACLHLVERRVAEPRHAAVGSVDVPVGCLELADAVTGEQRACKPGDLRLRREIDDPELAAAVLRILADLAREGFAPVVIATPEDPPGAEPRETERGRTADSARRTGDHARVAADHPVRPACRQVGGTYLR